MTNTPITAGIGDPWRPVIFPHVPKTGGSSLRSVFDHQYGRSRVLRVNRADPRATVDALARLPGPERRSISALVGHMPYGIDDALGVRCTYVTMMRHPVKRVVSLHAYLSRSGAERLGWSIPRGMSLEAFLTDWEQAPLVRNEQARQIAGPFPDGTAEASDSTLAQAKRNIIADIPVVGLTERFDESVLVMQNVLGWAPPRYARRKVAPRQQSTVVPLELRALIADLNSVDVQLYEWVRARFDALVKQHGVTAPKVQAFRRENTRYLRRRNATSKALLVSNRLRGLRRSTRR